MDSFDFSIKLVNNTNVPIGLGPIPDLAAGETRSVKTSEIRELNRVRHPKWRIPVEVKDRRRRQPMTLDPIKHLLKMTVIVFAYESDGAGAAGKIIARGRTENYFGRFFPYFSSENEEDFTDIDLYPKRNSVVTSRDLMGDKFPE